MAKVEKKGPQLLNEYLDDEELLASEFAKRIECAPSYISMIRHGKARPSITRAKRIQVETRGAVPADSWA